MTTKTKKINNNIFTLKEWDNTIVVTKDGKIIKEATFGDCIQANIAFESL